MINTAAKPDLPAQGNHGLNSLGNQTAGKRAGKDFTAALKEQEFVSPECHNRENTGANNEADPASDALGEIKEASLSETPRAATAQSKLSALIPELATFSDLVAAHSPEQASDPANWANCPQLFSSSLMITNAPLLADKRGYDTEPVKSGDATNFADKRPAANFARSASEQLTSLRRGIERGNMREDAADDKPTFPPSAPKAMTAENQKLPAAQMIIASGQPDQKGMGAPVPFTQTVADSGNSGVLTGSNPSSFAHAMSSMAETGLIASKINSKLQSLHFHMTVPELGSFSVRFGGRDEVASVALTPTGTEQSEEVLALQEEMNLWLAQTVPAISKPDVSMQTGQNAPPLADLPQHGDRKDGSSGPGHQGQQRGGETSGKDSSDGRDRQPGNGVGEKFGKWQKI